MEMWPVNAALALLFAVLIGCGQINGSTTSTSESTDGTGSLTQTGLVSGAAVYGSSDNTTTLYANNTAFMTLLTTGKIGVGTTSPGDRLQVSFTNTAAVPTSSLTSAVGAGITVHNTDAAAGYAGIQFITKTSSGNGALIALEQGSSFNDGSLVFRIRNGPSSSHEALRLQANGNVGIGTTTPQSSLQVNGYVQLGLTTGAPPAADCDAVAELGRMKVDTAASLLYICMDSGWVSK